MKRARKAKVFGASGSFQISCKQNPGIPGRKSINPRLAQDGNLLVQAEAGKEAWGRVKGSGKGPERWLAVLGPHGFLVSNQASPNFGKTRIPRTQSQTRYIALQVL